MTIIILHKLTTNLTCKPIIESIIIRSMQQAKKKPKVKVDENQVDNVEKSTSKVNIVPENTSTMPLEDINSDNTQDISSTKVLENIVTTGNQYLGEASVNAIKEQYSINGNSFTIPDNTKDKPVIVPNTKIKQSPQILIIDQGIKLTVEQLDNISTRLGIQIEKNAELATKWETIKVKLDNYIKSLEGVNYKKAFTYVGCGIAIAYFVYQMGIYRKLPDFLISIASHIPLPNLKGNDVPVPKPTIESTLNNVMDAPLTPLTIVTGIGSIVTLLGIVKISLWVIRKLKK